MKFSKYLQSKINSKVNKLTDIVNNDFLQQNYNKLNTIVKKSKEVNKIKKVLKDSIEGIVKEAVQEVEKELIKQASKVVPKNNVFKKILKFFTKILCAVFSEKGK